MPAGRPTLYTPGMCERVIELGKTGASKVEMAADLGLSRSAFDVYENTYPEFKEAASEAVHMSQAWWEKKGREATFGECPGFNATSYTFNMKNRFKEDWRDKVETEQSGTVNHNHSISQADKDILERFKNGA